MSFVYSIYTIRVLNAVPTKALLCEVHHTEGVWCCCSGSQLVSGSETHQDIFQPGSTCVAHSYVHSGMHMLHIAWNSHVYKWGCAHHRSNGFSSLSDKSDDYVICAICNSGRYVCLSWFQHKFVQWNAFTLLRSSDFVFSTPLKILIFCGFREPKLHLGCEATVVDTFNVRWNLDFQAPSFSVSIICSGLKHLQKSPANLNPTVSGKKRTVPMIWLTL